MIAIIIFIAIVLAMIGLSVALHRVTRRSVKAMKRQSQRNNRRELLIVKQEITPEMRMLQKRHLQSYYLNLLSPFTLMGVFRLMVTAIVVYSLWYLYHYVFGVENGGLIAAVIADILLMVLVFNDNLARLYRVPSSAAEKKSLLISGMDSILASFGLQLGLYLFSRVDDFQVASVAVSVFMLFNGVIQLSLFFYQRNKHYSRPIRDFLDQVTDMMQ